MLTFVAGRVELHDIRICPEVPNARGRPEPECRAETPGRCRVRRGRADLYISSVSWAQLAIYSASHLLTSSHLAMYCAEDFRSTPCPVWATSTSLLEMPLKLYSPRKASGAYTRACFPTCSKSHQAWRPTGSASK